MFKSCQTKQKMGNGGMENIGNKQETKYKMVHKSKHINNYTKYKCNYLYTHILFFIKYFIYL